MALDPRFDDPRFDGPRFDGWVPFRTYWPGNEPWVDWCHVGATRFTDPFFETTIHHAVRTPFNSLFRRSTPIAELARWRQTSPGLLPAGFIFHMSRCGSTLITQLLASLPQNVVLAEPPPLDVMLLPHPCTPEHSTEERVAWLQWLVSALGQPRTGTERRLFIKFDPRSLVALPLLRQAFPDVPWIFVYRNPVEVMVSNLRRLSAFATPGLLGLDLPGVAMSQVASMPEDEYVARVLGMVLENACRHFPDPLGMPVSYTQLPGMIWGRLPKHFGVVFSASEVDGLRIAATFDAKRPGQPFVDDSQTKNREATGRIRLLADQWIAPHYAKLEELRLHPPHGRQF